MLEIIFGIIGILVFALTYLWPPKNQRIEDKLYGGSIALFMVSILFYFIE